MFRIISRGTEAVIFIQEKGVCVDPLSGDPSAAQGESESERD